MRELWARSAGVCAFPGCGDVLYKDTTLLRSANLAEVAHNVASSADGPRGDAKRSHQLSDDPANLILFCRKHHKTVDEGGAEHYPELLLKAWKENHERNVLMVASLSGDQVAKPLIIRGPIGGQLVTVDRQAVVRAMVDNHTAPSAEPVEIDLPGDAHEPGEGEYWKAHANTIRKKLDLHHDGKTKLALFPLAEMPSLIFLGRLLGDKIPAQLYQYDRHAKSWSFQKPDAKPADFTFNRLGKFSGPVALKIGLSAPVSDERVTSVMGMGIPIVDFKTSVPGTGLVQSEATIVAFSRAIRACMEMIEQQGGTAAAIHVFPAMPAPLAVALGATVMPKVSSPLQIYDARGPEAPFKKALTLPLGVQ